MPSSIQQQYRDCLKALINPTLADLLQDFDEDVARVYLIPSEVDRLPKEALNRLFASSKEQSLESTSRLIDKEKYALAKIKRFCENCANQKETVKEILDTEPVLPNNTDRQNLLYYCVNHNYISLTRFLIAYGVDVNSKTQSVEQKTNHLTPLMAACKNNNVALAELLVANGASMLDENGMNQNILWFTHKFEMIELMIRLAEKNNCLDKLLNHVDKNQQNIYEFLCTVGQGEIFKNLLNLLAHPGVKEIKIKTILGFARIAGFEYPHQAKNFDEAARTLKKWITQVSQPPGPFEPTASQSPQGAFDASYLNQDNNNTSTVLPETLFGKLSNVTPKLNALTRVITQFYVLLNDPMKSMKYLKFLDEELNRYYIESHGKNFPSLSNEEYCFKTLNDLYYPMPTEEFKGISKHKALQEYLFLLFISCGLAKHAFKWIGYIPEIISNKILSSGDFATESRLGIGLFHGALSHMIQRAILIFAFQDGEFDITYQDKEKKCCLTLNEILEALINIISNDNKQLRAWVRVLDRRSPKNNYFSDPHRLNSFIMRYGHNLQINCLADSLIDSFCKGAVHMLEVYNEQRDHQPLTMIDLYDQFNDVPLHVFYLSPTLLANAIGAEVEKKKQIHKGGSFLHCPERYAVVKQQYTPNHNFEIRQFADTSKNKLTQN